MSVTQYIGARYVPLFAEPLEWDSMREYEPLTIVIYQGASYTSRQAVPVGIDINNETFWALTGNYNAQVEAYRREVREYDGRITANAEAIATEEDRRETADAQLTSDIEAEAAAREAADTQLQETIENDVQTAINAEKAARKTADTRLTNDIEAEATAREAADDAEAAAREAADNAETAAREAADEQIFEFINNQVKSSFLMPEYIGSFTNYSGMFKEPNTQDNHPIYTQSITLDANGNFKFIVVNKQDTNAHIVSANIENNSVNEDTTNRASWGHANNLTYNPDNNRYYINIGSNIVQQQFAYVVTDANFNEIAHFNSPDGGQFGHIVYDNITSKMYLISNDNIYNFNPADNTCDLNPVQLQSPIEETGETMQGAAIYNNILVFPVTLQCGNILKVYNVTTGEKLFTFNFPEHSAFYPLGEIEDCTFDKNGNMYFSSIMCYETYERYYSTTVLYMVNFFKGYGVRTNSQYSEMPPILYTECTNYTGFRSDGTSQYPFKSLEELSLSISSRPQTRKINLGGESVHSTQNEQTWFGFIQITGTFCTIHFAGTGKITIQGAIVSKDNAIIKIRNRATFKEFYGANNKEFVRMDDGILLATTVIANSTPNSGSTWNAVVSLTGCGMASLQAVDNNVGATKTITNYNSGFGYYLGAVRNGTLS